MAPSAKASPNLHCPLCGGDNACAPARSGSFDTPCWCSTITVNAAALARLTPAQGGGACLCPRCARGEFTDAAKS